MSIRFWPTTAIALLTALISCGRPPALREKEVDNVIRVSAAISLSNVLTTITRDYQKTTGTRVELNLAGSDTLATQLIAGAPADLFVSADTAQMDRIAQRGLVQLGTRVDLLSNQLVIVIPVDQDGEIVAPADLQRPEIRRIALGDPEAVPAGVYAKAYLESLGVWPYVRDKVVPTRDVRSALAAVETGNVDAAIVYRTDVVLAQGLRTAIEISSEYGPVIRYPAAVLRDTQNDRSARDLLKYLTGEHARLMFERAGFIVLGKRGNAR